MSRKYSQILTKKFLEQEYITNRKSIREIEKDTKIDRRIISRKMNKYNIKRRTHSEATTGYGKVEERVIDKSYFCIDCGKKIGWSTGLYGTSKCGACGQKKRRKNAITKKTYNCKKCNRKICYPTALYGSGLCLFCAMKERETLSEEHKRNIGNAHKGKKISLETRKKVSLSKGGTGIPYENYDLSFAIRLLSKNKQWRTEVFKRDNFTCQECRQIGGQLEVHHIKSFAKTFKQFLNKYFQYNSIKDKQILLTLAIKYKLFWNIDNGKTLCKDCHKLTDNYKNKKEKTTCLK